jgi:CxxC motif-containing protein (DUF1111 family)
LGRPCRTGSLADPKWGVGQRIFFPHDGRISDLLQAIVEHQSAGSKANMVIYNFTALSKDLAAGSAEMSERSRWPTA